MKLQDYVYQRPDPAKVKETYENLTPQVQNATTADAQIAAVDQVMALRKELFSMRELVKIRYAQNTSEPFYRGEDAFWASFNPVWTAMDLSFLDVLRNSPFCAALEEKYGKQTFTIIDHEHAVFSDDIVEEIKQENTLISESIRLSAGNVILDGKEQPYPAAVALFSSTDRAQRQKGFAAYEDFFVKRAADFDRVFYDLIKVRQAQAKKLGFASYVDMSFRIRQRVRYTLQDVRKLREEVKEYVVPVNTEIRRMQRERLGLEKLYFYDEEIMFPSLPRLEFKGEDAIKEITRTAMKNLGKEADEYYSFLMDRELLDLYARPNKALGGMTYYVPKYASPMIETNFSDIPYDVNVYAHELGHGFQAYRTPVPEAMELFYPGSDTMEVHAMSMEFFFWKNYDLYFDGDLRKQKYTHLASVLQTLAWCCIIDEFQDIVYSREDYTPEDYKEIWKKLEKEYLPHRYYGEDSFFNQGTFWYKQLHLFQTPFYYIDYALAQTSAIQFFMKDNEDHETAWQAYLKLCQVGGNAPYLDAIAMCGISSPFEDGLIERLSSYCKNYLDHIFD